MKNLLGVSALVGALIFISGCSHLAIEDRYRSKVQVVQLAECPKLEGLRQFELGLFNAGFVRGVARVEEPVPFELLDNLVATRPRLVTFTKSDFEVASDRGSAPYREIVNRYKIAACEEPAGGLYLIVVRHDSTAGDQFLGTRLKQALIASGCKTSIVALPIDLDLYQNGIEEDLLHHIQRGHCRDHGSAK